MSVGFTNKKHLNRGQNAPFSSDANGFSIVEKEI